MAFSKQQLQKFADLIKIEISDEKLAEMNIDSVVGEGTDITMRVNIN